MKHIFLLLVLSFLALTSHCQDSISFSIKGTITDIITQRVIPYPEVTLRIKHTIIASTKGDSLGHYELTGQTPLGDIIFSFQIQAIAPDNYHRYIEEFKLINKSVNNTYNVWTTWQNFQLMPSKDCWDSFLPRPIQFVTFKCDLDSSYDASLIHWSNSMTKSIKEDGNFKSRLEIIAYCSLDEDLSIAEKRGKYIYDLFAENGFNKDDLILTIKGQDDFFHCEYCDGCHPFVLKGLGYNVTKKLIEDTNDTKQKEKYQNMRRIVDLKWVK